MPGVAIRDAGPDDVAALVALDRRVMAAYGLGEGPPRPDLAGLDRAYAAPDGAFLVAEAAGAIVGMAGFLRQDGRTARLRRLRVAPDWRRRGIAARLLALLEGRARAAGYERIFLHVTAAQEEALAFYPRHGYRPAESPAGPESIHFEKMLG